MKKICILSTVDEKRMTMITMYTQFFDRNNISYDLICINKNEQNINMHATNKFIYNMPKNIGYLRKIMHLKKFRDYAIEIIKNERYDLLVTWNELTAFVFSDFLKKYLPNKYIVNIRDYHYFKNPFVNNKISRAIKYSLISTVSSPGLISYFRLQEEKIIPIYGYKKEFLEDFKLSSTKGEVIRIGYIGQIRWIENIYQLLDRIGNDSRYSLILAGRGAYDLKDDNNVNKYDNVVFFPEFESSETAKYLENVDVLFNIYGNENLHKSTALSIKLFYSISLRIPILTSKNTYTDEIAKKLGIGFTFEKQQSEFADNFYKWYNSFDQLGVKEKCEKYLLSVTNHQKKVVSILSDYLSVTNNGVKK